MCHEVNITARFFDDLFIYILRENGLPIYHIRNPEYLTRYIKPVFSPEMGKLISHYSCEYKFDYKHIFKSIMGEMKKHPDAAERIFINSVYRLVESLIFDSEDVKRFFIFCAILSEMFLYFYKRGFYFVCSGISISDYCINKKLRWNEEGCDLKKYETFVKSFNKNGM